MTDDEISMLRHTVGADSEKPGYRNMYCTHVSNKIALSLVDQGLLAGPEHQGSFGPAESCYFFATDKAFKLLGIKPGAQ